MRPLTSLVSSSVDVDKLDMEDRYEESLSTKIDFVPESGRPNSLSFSLRLVTFN
jgi:hypothetical protein